MEEEGVTDPNLAFHVDPSKLSQDRGRATRRTKDRNEAEKDRRDRTNAILGKLADYLSRELTGNRKLDKCSILCLVVNCIRINKLTKECINKELSNIKGLYKYLEDMDDVLVEHFMMIREEDGILLYATQALTNQLGHSLVDVIGHSMFDIIHPDDQRELARQFFSISGDERKEFRLRILDNTSKHSSDYLTVHIEGIIKQFRVTVNKLERVLLCHWNLSVRQPSRLGQELVPAIHSTNNAWLSCHDLQGRLTYSSPTCAMLTGFLPNETLGLSAYSLLHTEDLGPVAAMHNLYLQEGFSRKTIMRLKTKDQRYIPVATLTHLVTKWNKQPDYIVSLNLVLEKDEWERLYKQQDDLIRSRAIDVSSSAEVDTCDSGSNSMDSPHSTSYLSSTSELSPNSSVKSGGIVTISAKRKIHIVDTNPVKKLCDATSRLPGDLLERDNNTTESDIIEEVCPKPEFLGEDGEDDISVIIRTNIDSSQSTTSCPSRDNSQCLSPDATGDISLSTTVDFADTLPQQRAHHKLYTLPPQPLLASDSDSFPFGTGTADFLSTNSNVNSTVFNNPSTTAVGNNGGMSVSNSKCTKYSLLQNINRSLASSSRNPQQILEELQKPAVQPVISTSASQKIQDELFDGIDPTKLHSLLSMFLTVDSDSEYEIVDSIKQVENSLSTIDSSPLIDLNPKADLTGLCTVPSNGLHNPPNHNTQTNAHSDSAQVKPYQNEPEYLYGVVSDSLSLDNGSLLPSSQESVYEFCSDRVEPIKSQFVYQGTVTGQDKLL